MTTANPTSNPYLHHSSVLMLFLGFVAGIPILLIFSSLSLWLREAGIDRATVTMFSWAALGYSFKFIWSPLIDSLPVPSLNRKLGRRRSWLLVSQLGVIMAIVLMAMTNPANEQLLTLMAFGAVLLGFSSATQDIVIDAYRIESAPVAMQPILSAMYTAGYRVGMIVAGAGALYLADSFGSTADNYSYHAWQYTYLIMAGIMSIGLITTLTLPEPNTKLDAQNTQKQQNNLRLMKYYSLIALTPVAIFGIWYLANKLIMLIAKLMGNETLILGIPTALSKFIISYMGIMALIAPIALIYLIINQPKFSSNIAINSNNNKTYFPLVGTFIFGVVGFIIGFRTFGAILPETKEVLFGFALESVRLSGGLLIAFLVGKLLIKIGFIQKETINSSWIAPITDFFSRYGKKAIILLALIGLYRISDIVAGVISNVFYQDMGFSKTDIADAVKLVGVLMAILGGFLGGYLALKVRIMQAMMIGAILACATNLLFIVLAHHQGQLPYLYMAVILDNLASGLASSIFIAFLSALTSIRFTAVQYALFSSLMTLFPKVLGGYSGTIVSNTSYPTFFMITFVIGLPILHLIYLADKHIDLNQKTL